MTAWQRGARLVKNPKVENEYMDHIRDIHDPSLHLKTIEDELMGTIGKALGKQGEKINMYRRAMAQEYQRYQEVLSNIEEEGCNEEHSTKSQRLLLESAQKFNQYRKDAIQARWELMVHRQAAGFLVNNHKFVMEKFPIVEALPEDEVSTGEDMEPKSTAPPPKTFGDQLDWWQRVGRWR